MKKAILQKQISRGFTLVELLVVIAVIGILAAVILIAIDPGEQMARGRDSSRKIAVSQLGRAVQSYYTSQGGSYPTGAGWATELVTKNEIKAVPQNNTTNFSVISANWCNAGTLSNGFCYRVANPTDAVVYTLLESKNERARSCTTDTSTTYFVWSSKAGRAGAVCDTEPTVGTSVN